mmetsp:Transcript_35390/g.92582  ORF Transcript_35390/g.92582 Transcript_35390/m.92582 type:complete len:255 (+) Transcript_35390:1938-2702(+)
MINCIKCSWSSWIDLLGRTWSGRRTVGGEGGWHIGEETRDILEGQGLTPQNLYPPRSPHCGHAACVIVGQGDKSRLCLGLGSVVAPRYPNVCEVEAKHFVGLFPRSLLPCWPRVLSQNLLRQLLERWVTARRRGQLRLGLGRPPHSEGGRWCGRKSGGGVGDRLGVGDVWLDVEHRRSIQEVHTFETKPHSTTGAIDRCQFTERESEAIGAMGGPSCPQTVLLSAPRRMHRGLVPLGRHLALGDFMEDEREPHM